MGAISTSAPTEWHKADAITGLIDGDPVATWVDSGSGGLNATQATSGNRPLYKTNIVNGLPVVRFDGSNDYLQSSGSASAGTQTIIAVVNCTNGSGVPAIVGPSANGGFEFRISGNKVQVLKPGTTNLTTGADTIADSTWHILVGTFDSGAFSSVRANGANDLQKTAQTLTAALTVRIGCRNTAVDPFAGDMAEVIKWDRALTATEVKDVEAELATKYGLTNQAPERALRKVTTFTASSTFASYSAGNLYDDSLASTSAACWRSNVLNTGTVAYEWPAAFVAKNYTLWARSDTASDAPRDWTLEGSNDGSSWTTLDTRSSVTFSGTTPQTFTPSAFTTEYLHYRLNITATTSGNQPLLAEWHIEPALLPVAATFDGQIDAVSATQGDLLANRLLDGQVDATSATSGDLLANPLLDGQVDATSATEGTIGSATTHPLDGQIDATSDTEGALRVNAALDGQIDAVSGTFGGFVGAALAGVNIEVGVTLEVGALTLLNLVALPGTEIPVGAGLTAGDSEPVVPLPGVNIAVGVSLITRTSETVTPDPRGSRPQWRYVVTDLANTPLGELTDITHDPVADGVNTPTTMKFVMAADDPARALIEAAEPMTRKCQVWEGDSLLLWGPLLPDQQTDDTTAGYTVHDPSWWWRGGRRNIGRYPRLNLLRNGDFKQGLTYWTRGYDADSIPASAPTVRVVDEDFLDDEDGIDPIKAAEIVGVESVTESELSSNAVFYPNRPFAWEPLDAGFRPEGPAAIEAVADDMPTTAGLKVLIVGHTANDGTGSGMELSLRRAQAAAQIVQAKRPGAVITTKGVGFYDPKPGYPVDSQAQRRVVISYDQTITGKSKQWMKQTIEVSQPKSARYPLELTLAAMLKVADDWSVEDANMVSLKIVVRRKGAAKPVPWDAQLGTGESSISDTDPVDRWIPQTAQATVPADGRTYQVDVYLYAPAALARYTAVGLFPEEMLYFWGVDQALIFKGIVEHIQSAALGHGNLGIETRTPLTGIKRDRTYPFRDHMAADTALEEFGSLNRGMDYDTLMLPDGRTILATYYPQQGKQAGYTLVQGGNVVGATPEHSRDVASSIIMQAQDLGSYRAEAYAKDSRAFGGLLFEKVVTAEQETPLNELREAARQELAWGRGSTTGYWLDIDPDSIEEVRANTSKGDRVRLILDAPVAVDTVGRILNRENHPDSLRLFVAVG